VLHACYAEAKRRRWREPLRLITGREPRARDETDDVVNRDRIERGFRRISVEHRAVLVLHHYVGLHLTEIAAVLGVPGGTARSRLHYAGKALRDSIEIDDTAATQRGMA